MVDKDFRVTMVDPDGGEFVAGSPEVVARLTAQGYRQQDSNESDATADEREQAAANVPAPAEGETNAGTTQTADGPKSGPDFENVDANAPKTTDTDAGKQATGANTPGGKSSRSSK